MVLLRVFMVVMLTFVHETEEIIRPRKLGRHLRRPMTSEEVLRMLVHYKVVPDVIDKNDHLLTLTVVYNYTIFIDFGTRLTPHWVENRPTTFYWPVATGNAYYCLVFLEPDHPIRREPHDHQYVHWLVVNIPGTQVGVGEEIVEYVGYRSYFYDKKPHRYVYLVYKQPSEEKMNFDEKHLIEQQVIERGAYYNFTARNFAKKYNLSEPVATNLAFIKCNHLWHGRKYKVFKNQTTPWPRTRRPKTTTRASKSKKQQVRRVNPDNPADLL